MKLIVTGVALVLAGCITFSAKAATTPDISWNYLSAGYAKANIKFDDGARFKPDGYQLNASYLLSDSIYVKASYYDVGNEYMFGDIAGLDLEFSELAISLGMRDDISDSVDSFFEVGFARSVSGLNGFEQDKNSGISASAGFRSRVTPQLELAIAASYSEAFDTEDKIFGDLSARYRITPMFDVYASYQSNGDFSLMTTGVVFNF